MGIQPGLFFRALVERFPNPILPAVLEAAPETIASQLRTFPERAGIAPELLVAAPRRLFLSIHPSWREEIVKRCPKAFQPRIQAVLQGAHEHEDPVALFLLDHLISQWPDKDVQGVEAIEETPLRWLADCDERQVNTIAELLAVHDMVDIVRQIVEKKILQKILLPFTPLQQRYLRVLLRRPARVASLNKELLSLLCDEPEKAKNRLMKRGIERLGQSLQGAPPLLVWHVLHHLDQKQAQMLSKIMGHAASESEISAARRGAIDAYDFLKRTETP